MAPPTYYLHTLGCAKNEVDSSKIKCLADQRGFKETELETADYVVINTCAFIEEAKLESIEAIFDAKRVMKPASKLIITGCLAERYGDELFKALPEVDLVTGFGKDFFRPIAEGLSITKIRPSTLKSFDLLNYKRSDDSKQYAYIKISEGCDRKCAFCAIPTFRGKHISRSLKSVLEEAKMLNKKELVVVGQDVVSYGKDLGPEDNLPNLLRQLNDFATLVRVLYVYPARLDDYLIRCIGDYGSRYFDLSLQHASENVLKLMKRPGSFKKFLNLIEKIRAYYPDAAIRSSFIVGHPGELEDDYLVLKQFIEQAELDWATFFLYSNEENTQAYNYDRSIRVTRKIALERINELTEIQHYITSRKRSERVGTRLTVLVESHFEGRSHLEAPEIDGSVRLTSRKTPGEFVEGVVIDSDGLDLVVDPHC